MSLHVQTGYLSTDMLTIQLQADRYIIFDKNIDDMFTCSVVGVYEIQHPHKVPHMLL